MTRNAIVASSKKLLLLCLLQSTTIFSIFAQAPNISYTGTHTYTVNSAITPFSPVNTGGAVPTKAYGAVSFYAGTGTSGATNGDVSLARFRYPMGLAIDGSGNMYVADRASHTIRKITPAGVVSTFAGSGSVGSTNGTGTAARFNQPNGVAVDSFGNVYVADTENHLIRKITSSGVVTTFAGTGTAGNNNGAGNQATFDTPTDVATDAAGNVYVTDNANHNIRKINSAGVVSTLAGTGVQGADDGNATTATFSGPSGLTVDAAGNVYVADQYNSTIRKITPRGLVTTLAGAAGIRGLVNETGTAARFNLPADVTVDAVGNVYVSEQNNNTLRKISPAGVVTTVAGNGYRSSINDIGTDATLNNPRGLVIDAAGDLYVTDMDAHRIRKVLMTGYSISPQLPLGLTFDTATGTISGTPANALPSTTYTVSAYNVDGQSTTTFYLTVNAVGSSVAAPNISYIASQTFAANSAITPFSPTSNGGAVPATVYAQVSTIAGSTTAGSANGTGAAASFSTPTGITVDPLGNIYVADRLNHQIRKITPSGVVTTLAGAITSGTTNGTGNLARFDEPTGITIDIFGNIFVADADNNLIRKITPSGTVSTYAGTGASGTINGAANQATFNTPFAITKDAAGNLYISDYDSHNIRKISGSGVVSTLAGGSAYGFNNATGTSARFYNPSGITHDADGNIYVADRNNQRIRKITPAGVVSTFAGAGGFGTVDGNSASATFNGPAAIVMDQLGNFYVADQNNNLIRKISSTGIVSTLAGNATAGSTDGIGTAARFNNPQGITIDAAGNLYLTSGNLIRKIATTGYSISPALPAGLVFDATTGTISGTPTASNPSTVYTVTAYNTGGENTTTFSLTVTAPIPVPNITYHITQNFTVNTAIAPFSPTNTGGAISSAYSISPTLPPGFTFDTVTGTISGTPTSAQATTTYTVTVANGSGQNTATFDITVNTPSPVVAAPSISLAASQTFTANAAITPFMPTNSGGAVPATVYGQVNTTISNAGLNNPWGIATDAAGNMYVADQGNHVIRKITPSGTVNTLAGSGTIGSANGTGTAASFNTPTGIATDIFGNIYVADKGNNLIRKITPAGIVTTYAGTGAAGTGNGAAAQATFNEPTSVVIDPVGNAFVTDNNNLKIRKISYDGNVTTLAGTGAEGTTNGAGNVAKFRDPKGITIDAAGNLYVADQYNQLIRKITPSDVVSTLAGVAETFGALNGAGTSATFYYPANVAADQSGNVYVADLSNHLLRKISTTGVVTTLAGSGDAVSTDGIGSAASFSSLAGLAVGTAGDLYVVDATSNQIRKVVTTGYSLMPNLPAGLSFDSTTGTISGTPTAALPSTTYTITAHNIGGSSSANFNLTINPSTPPVAAPNISYEANKTLIMNTITAPISPENTGGAVPATVYGQVSTVAGTGAAGFTNGTGTAASFNQPASVTTDAMGNIYVAEISSHVIRKITPAGVVTTLAGVTNTAAWQDGTGTSAYFNQPTGVTTDYLGNIYVADKGNILIRKITPSGLVTTYAGIGNTVDGIGDQSTFADPYDIVADAQGNFYVAENGGRKIRKINTAGIVSTLAGTGSNGFANGTGNAATFGNLKGIAVDATGNLYVADQTNHLIRKITPNGTVSTVAGVAQAAGSTNGTTTVAKFNNPADVATDQAGYLYVADASNHLIRKISPTGEVTTLAGSGTSGSANGIGTAARFNNPQGIAVDAAGDIYVADLTGHLIRKIVNTGYTISPALPAGLTFDSTTGIITGTPTTTLASTVYTVTAHNAGGASSTTFNLTVTTPPPPVVAPNISYNINQNFVVNTAITALSPANSGGDVPATVYGEVSTFAGNGTSGATNGAANVATFNSPTGLSADAVGNIYIADKGNNLIRKITSTGTVTTLAGNGTAGFANGTGTSASFNGLTGVVTDAAGNSYVADKENNLIRKITPAGVVTTFAGTGTAGTDNGAANQATFNAPYGISLAADGSIYVSDQAGQKIRKITSSGTVSTLAGSGTAGANNGEGSAASFNSPSGLATDAAGNSYVADQTNQLVRKITAAGITTTLAGNAGTTGSTNGNGTDASFNYPTDVATDAVGYVYVADAINNLVRKISPTGTVTTLAGSGISGSVNGIGTAASFNKPSGVAFLSGALYVSDMAGNQVRKIVTTGYSISPALPAGLTFDATTGTITGTPTSAAASTTYTVTAYNAGGESSTTFNITVTAPTPTVAAPAISYTASQNFTANTAITPFAPANSGGAVPATVYGTVSTIAGNGSTGSANGIGTAANFNNPTGIAIDNASGDLYVADYRNHLIRKITPSGTVSTLAGSGAPGAANGTGNAASFNLPFGVATDVFGNVYVADRTNNLIRKITASGIVSTYAGTGSMGTNNGAVDQATFSAPQDVFTDASGNVYVTDNVGLKIRKINAATVSTLAGSGLEGATNGNANLARFSDPNGIASDAAGNVYVADQYNQLIRKITPSGVVSTLAGMAGTSGAANGTGTAASFYYPADVAVAPGDYVYVADASNNLIRTISPTGLVSTLAGTGTEGSANGIGTAASFGHPSSVVVSASGHLYVTDMATNLIRKIVITGYSISPTLPAGLTFDPTTGTISGTPTVALPTTLYTVTAYNTGGVSIATFSLTVASATPTITSFTSTAGTQNGANLTNLPIVGGSTITITGTNFVAGMTISAGADGPVTVVSPTTATFVLAAGTPLAVLTPTVTTTNGTSVASATLTYAPSDVATLAALVLSTGTLTPSFDPNISNYTMNVPNEVTSMTVTPTASDANAQISVLGADQQSGTPSLPISLNPGQNEIFIVVKSQSGKVIKGYDIYVTRALADQAITFNTLAPKTYGDTPFALSATGGASGNPITYTSSNPSIANISGNTVTILSTGNVTITAHQAGNAAYNPATSVAQELVIGKKEIAIAAVAKSKNYAQADPALTYTITSGALVGTDAFTGALTRNAGENVGTYAIEQGTLALNNNYVLTYASANFTIAKQTANLSLSNLTHTYDGTAKSATATISPNGLTGISVTYNGSTSAPSTAGTYVVVASLTNSNYQATPVNGTLIISPAAITVTANAQSKIYGETDPALTYTVSSGTLKTGDTFAGALTRDAGENAGSYAIKQGTLTLNSNYTLSFSSANFTILKANATVALGNLSHTYDGTAKSATATTNPSGLSGVTITYNGSATPPSSVGTYAVVASLTNTNYQSAVANGTLTIAPIAITVTANAKTKVYGETDPVLTYTVTAGALKTGDNFTGSLTRDIGETVNPYAIKRGSLALNANYTLNFVNADLTITKAQLTVTASNATQVFGATNPLFTLNYTGFVNGETKANLTAEATASTSATTASNVGTYAISPVNAVSNNYSFVYVNGILSITPASRSLSFSQPMVAIFGDADLAPSATATSGETINYSSDNTSVATIINGKIHIVGAGTAHITASLPTNSNYNAVSPVSQQLTVNKAAQTISFANSIPVMNRVTGSFNLNSVTSSSGLPVTFTVDDAFIASVQGTTLTAHRIGITTITATQAGNANYLPATAQTRTVTVVDGIDGNSLIVKQAMSPNGDGINDFLYIEGIQNLPNNKVTIFTRSGAKVFTINNYDNKIRVFDGRSNSGKIQAGGTYYYAIETEGKPIVGWFVLKY